MATQPQSGNQMTKIIAETFYYCSPLGKLTLTGNNESLTGLVFEKAENAGKGADVSVEQLPIVSPVIKKCIAQLDDYFSGRYLCFDIPLHQSGTPFQQKVWEELRNIPAGQTISYLQLSKKLGDPKAIRAVGMANGKNNIAVIVPCHRVIGSNGHLVGYGGDLWRKKWLLQHEAKFLNGVQTLF
jgi:methylated-DNA-[protein]-cysteine S-methyltransferase